MLTFAKFTWLPGLLSDMASSAPAASCCGNDTSMLATSTTHH